MKFRRGDLCYFEGLHSRRVEFNGTECMVLDSLAERYGSDTQVWRLCHTVNCALDGRRRLVEPQHLRLKRPPEWNSWLADTSEVQNERGTKLLPLLELRPHKVDIA